MADEGRGGFKLFNFGDERRKRQEAAAAKAIAAAHPDSFAIPSGTLEALHAQYASIANRAINDLSKSPNIHDRDTFWAHASSMTTDQLALAVNQYQNDEVKFRRDNGDSKAYAIMERARQVFSR